MHIWLISGIIIVNLFIKDKEFISNKNKMAIRDGYTRYESVYVTSSYYVTTVDIEPVPVSHA